MIGGKVCVSCYNRQREVIAGKDAKHRKPIHLRPVVPIDISYTVDGSPRRLRLRYASGRIELMSHVLRTTPGTILFHFHSEPLATAGQRDRTAGWSVSR